MSTTPSGDARGRAGAMVRFLLGTVLVLILSSCASAPALPSVDGARPRHRVNETPEESARLIEPWRACMKDHDADACRGKLPLPPWGMDSANPAYRDNMHKWVQCMTNLGMHVAETPDNDESPWTYAGSNQPPNADKIEHDCAVAILGPSDK